MKYRMGFVSNSSSMSFVTDKRHYETIKDMAKAMIDYMFEIEKDWDFYNDERYKEYLKALEEAPDIEALKFNSCNFDTYIYNDGEKYYVETCNNHNGWEDIPQEYRMFTIKADFYDIHTKEFIDETIHDEGW